MPIALERELLKRRRTKIVATVGPASANAAVLAELIQAGVNVFRLNMSHGDHAGHRKAYALIREAASKAAVEVGVLADLCGPKIRCGLFEGGRAELQTGSTVTVTTRDVPGHAQLIPSQYQGIVRDVQPGSRILLDDGNLELRVEKVGTELLCTVVQGGVLKDRKGINLPDSNVSAPSLTDKDRADALFALALPVDFLALSFVRRASDIRELRDLIDANSGSGIAIIAKIEKPQALEEIEGILDAADGVMVARGDLGVEMPAETVPVIQSELIELARSHHKPVIVATQMLESMIANPRPTRAEVSDVSTAVMAGTDAVMLSAETASGAFPVNAVKTIDRVVRQAEAYLWKHGAFRFVSHQPKVEPPLELSDAVARAAAQLSRDLRVRAIFVMSRTGLTARIVSTSRPAAPVIAVSPDERTSRVMQLLWGVVPSAASPEAWANPEELARRLVQQYGLGENGGHILRVSGFHLDGDLNIPTISVLRVQG
jgi:pyruvate kinase